MFGKNIGQRRIAQMQIRDRLCQQRSIFRKTGDTNTADVDQSFELIYTINGPDTPISPTDGKVNGQNLNDTDKAKYQLTMTQTEAGKITSFKTGEVLDVKSGEKNWVYYVEETEVMEGYSKDGYGRKNTTETGGITKALGAEAAADGGVILNRESFGYELPATGGLGTNMLYLFGIMLTGLAGAGLVMKRRRRNVT